MRSSLPVQSCSPRRRTEREHRARVLWRAPPECSASSQTRLAADTVARPYLCRGSAVRGCRGFVWLATSIPRTRTEAPGIGPDVVRRLGLAKMPIISPLVSLVCPTPWPEALGPVEEERVDR